MVKGRGAGKRGLELPVGLGVISESSAQKCFRGGGNSVRSRSPDLDQGKKMVRIKREHSGHLLVDSHSFRVSPLP